MSGLALVCGPLVAPSNALAAGRSTAGESALFERLAKTPGVTVMPGIAWQVLDSGPQNGSHPTSMDTVTFRYVGKLIDGAQFDASGGDGAGEVSGKLSALIGGFAAALKLMRPGDRWRVYIPAYLAYGDQAKPTIPPGSTLVFDISLVSIKPAS